LVGCYKGEVMSLKNPSWTWSDIQLYNKLFYYDIGRELTEEEKEFCKTMYHMEEVACGLDGD
jgi:hypothetical protein